MDGEGRSPGPTGGALTVGALWHDIAGRRLGDELLEWAPDLFAFTDVVLARSEAYRFVVSPPEGASWPPAEMPDWSQAIADASAGWCAWEDGDGTEFPGLVAEEWAVVRERSATSLDELATGRAWRICQALITLHAIADEACAGTGAPGANRNPLADQPAAASGPPVRAQPRRRPLDPLTVALRLRPGPRGRRRLEPDPGGDRRAGRPGTGGECADAAVAAAHRRGGLQADRGRRARRARAAWLLRVRTRGAAGPRPG